MEPLDVLRLDYGMRENEFLLPKNWGISDVARRFWYFSPFIEASLSDKFWQLQPWDKFRVNNNGDLELIRQWKVTQIHLWEDYKLPESGRVDLWNGVLLEIQANNHFFHIQIPNLNIRDILSIKPEDIPQFRREFRKLKEMVIVEFKTKSLLWKMAMNFRTFSIPDVTNVIKAHSPEFLKLISSWKPEEVKYKILAEALLASTKV